MELFGVWVDMEPWQIHVLAALPVVYILYSLLFPAWNSENEKKALKAIAKIKDQAKLLKVAKKARLYAAQKAAIQKMTDQAFLAEVVKRRATGLWERALEKITDQNVLLDIIASCYNHDVRRAATAKLTDKKVARQALEELFYEYIKSDKPNPYDLLHLAEEVTQVSPQVIAQNWPTIRDAASKVHYDRWKYSGSSDCHDDSGVHSDNYGKEYLKRFPPYAKKG